MDGNRVWRVETPDGPVLQKLYGERGGCLHALAREVASRIRDGKTSTLAAGRRATERRLLELWRNHGFDVPRDITRSHPDLANDRTLILEFVPGRLLSQVLGDRPTDAESDAESRTALLRRFATEWGRRHRVALDHGEAGLVQEHGGFLHVIVSGDRLVTFDLENAFRPRKDLTPILAKEIAAYVRSLAKLSGPDRFEDDLRTLVAAYPERPLLEATVRHYLENDRFLWRVIWAIDQRREARRGRRHGKFAALRALASVLA